MEKKRLSLERQTEIAEKNLERILEWVTRFDVKSSIVLGIDTAMIGILATFAPRTTSWPIVTVAFSSLALVFLAASFLFVCFGASPRSKGPTKSLLYFGSIAKSTFDDYLGEFHDQTPEEYLHSLIEQCHRNADIIDRKFGSLRWAYGLLFLSILPWAGSIYCFNSSMLPK